MPPQESDGGSRDHRQDTMVARNLCNVLDVSEHQVNEFIKTRDQNMIHKLRMVLQDMPNTNWSGSRTPTEVRSQSACGSSEARRRARLQSRRDATQVRLDELKAMRTSYDNFFGSAGGLKPIQRTGVQAFDGMIRREYKPEFNEWAQNATDQQLRTLAESCRSLRSIRSSWTPVTTYGQLHGCVDSAHRPAAPVEKRNARNISAVPLGSIYAEAEREHQSALSRQATHEKQLNVAKCNHEDVMRRTLEPKPAARMCLYTSPPEPTMHSCMQATPNNWSSSSRVSWNPDVHSKTQVKRHQHAAIDPGMAQWLECRNDPVFNLRDTVKFGGGQPSAQKLVQSKHAKSTSLL